MKRLIFLLFAFLFLFSCGNKGGGTSVQSQDSLPPIPSQFQDEPVIALLDSVEVKMSEYGQMQHNTVRVFYIQKELPGLLRTIYVPYSKVSEEPVQVECEVTTPDGESWSLSSYDIKRENGQSAYDRSIIGNSSEMRYFTLPYYKKGMQIILKERRLHKGNLFTPALYFRDDYPILKKKMLIHQNAANQLLLNKENLPIEDSLIDEIHYYRASNLKARKQGGSVSKHDEEWFAAVHLSRFDLGTKAEDGWREIGDIYLKKIKSVMASDDQIKDLALEKKGSSAAESCDNYFKGIVEKVRYLFYLDSVSAITPELPRYVLRDGYGDCKGMSNLFRALLSEVYPELSVGLALISTEGSELQNETPSLDNFNHMIAWVVVDGDTLFVDPTNGSARWNQSMWELTHRKVFLLSPGESRVMTVRPNKQFVNRVISDNRVEVSEQSKTVSGRVTLQGLASSAIFRALQKMSNSDRDSYVKGWMFRRFNIDPKEYSLEKVSYGEVIFTYVADLKKQFISVDGGGVKLSVPSTYGGKTSYTTIENEGYFSFLPFEQKDTWELPEGFSELTFDAFNTALIEGEFAQANGIVSRNYRVNANLFITSEQLGSYFKDKKRINNTIIWR